MGVLNKPVLILNKNWTAIRIKDVKKAIQLVSRNRAVFVDEDNYNLYNWEEWIKIDIGEKIEGISTTKGNVRIPKVILLTVYGKIPDKNPKLTKKNIFIRDQYQCQYSGKKINRKNGDVDHIHPVSKGGKNTWDNMVICSKEINRKKGDKTLEEADLKLLKKPIRPKGTQLMIDPNKKYYECWKKFLSGK